MFTHILRVLQQAWISHWFDLLPAIGTIGMALIIVYIEIIGPRRNKPKVSVEFDNRIPFCRRATPLLAKAERYYVRIRVENTGRSVARRLKGKLVEVRTKDGAPREDFDPVFLHWVSVEPVRKAQLAVKEKETPHLVWYSDYTNYLDPIDLASKEFDYLDILSTGKEDGGRMELGTTPERRGARKSFRMSEGVGAFKITIYGEAIKPVTKVYELVWDGKQYDEVRMREKDF